MEKIKNVFGRKKVMTIALLVICIAILASGTLAYFVAEETAYNVITTGSLDMSLREETTGGEPWPEGGMNDVVPGVSVDKVAYIENTGEVDFYTRISFEKEIIPAEGVTKPLDFTHITLELNDTEWIEQDGYYYYHRPLKPGEKTEPLLSKVHFGAELGNEYQKAKIVITVNAQAVQSRNNTDSPLTASGWTSLADAEAEDETVEIEETVGTAESAE